MNIRWSRHDSVGEVKEFGVESMKAKLIEWFPPLRKSSLERHGTLVTFTCLGDRDPNQHSRSLLQSSGVSQLSERNEIFLTQIESMQEDRATPITDAAEFLDTTEADEMSKESVYIEQRQPLRSIEFDEWTLKERAKSIHETSTQRQQDIHELTHLLPGPWCSVCMSGEVADDHHWKRQDAKDSGLEVASFAHCDILAEVGMFNKKLMSKVLVSRRSEEVATVERPKDVIENMVRVICNGLEIWRVDVCTLKCPEKMAEIILQSAVDRMRHAFVCGENLEWRRRHRERERDFEWLGNPGASDIHARGLTGKEVLMPKEWRRFRVPFRRWFSQVGRK